MVVFSLQAVERVLFPHLPAYWANLQAVLDDNSVSNAQVKADGHKVYGAILVSICGNKGSFILPMSRLFKSLSDKFLL